MDYFNPSYDFYIGIHRLPLQVGRRKKKWSLLCWKFGSGEDADPPRSRCALLRGRLL
jgi:hypothetical protein